MANNTRKVDKKAIREYIKQALRQRFPGFDSLRRSRKKELLSCCAVAVKQLQEMGSSFDGVPEMTQLERLGLGQMPKNFMTLSEIEAVVEESKRVLFDLGRSRRRAMLEDSLLKFVDELLDDHVLNRILSTPSFTPTKRTWMPCHYFRTELLRTMKYPEWSVRKFCAQMKNEKKYAEERAFCGMDWRRGYTIDHSSLCSFRQSMTLAMSVNLMSYVASLFFRSGRLEKTGVFALDSSEVAIKIKNNPLVKIELAKGDFIRFYGGDLDCDCGARRKKRDKSEMLVGYRVHTLCAIDPDTKHAFPLLSLAVAANHHDSQVLSPLVQIGRAIGLEVKVLAADDAYADAGKKKELLESDDIMLVTPEKESKTVVANANLENGEVRLCEECPVPMKWGGYDKESHAHIFVCGDERRECFLQHRCDKERYIPMDVGSFGPIPKCVELAQNPIDLRKIAERLFNLLKHMDGLEPCRMKRKASVTAQVAFSQITGIFKVMAGERSRKTTQSEKRPVQKELKFA